MTVLLKEQKIYFLVYSLEGGGTERVIASLYPVLKKRINLRIITFCGKNDYNIPENNFINLNIPASGSILLKFFILLKRINKLKIFIRENKPSLIISFGESMNFINILASPEKAVISVRSIKSVTNEKSGIVGIIHDFFMKNLYKSAQSIIVISQVIKSDLVRNYHLAQDKIRVIYNPMDIALIRKSTKEKSNSIKEQNSIINIGRLHPVKDQISLINAFKKIYNPNKDHLYVIGKGELENKIKTIIKKDQLTGNITLLGWQKNPFKYLVKAKMFVLSSKWEGLGNVLLEALAAGVPIISTEASGIAYEVLNNNQKSAKKIMDDVYLCKYGIVVSDNNTEALGKAIRYLLDNKALQKKLKNIGRKYVENFSIEKISHQYLAVIHKVLREK